MIEEIITWLIIGPVYAVALGQILLGAISWARIIKKLLDKNTNVC